jgi:hypothetical protein
MVMTSPYNGILPELEMGAHDRNAGERLCEEIETRVRRIRVRSIDRTVESLVDDFVGRKIVVDPAHRGLFRWSPGRQSRLVESLLVELPLPPLTLLELDSIEASALADGLNRLFSMVHFVKGHPDKPASRLRLTDCDIVQQLNGMTFDDLPEPLKAKLLGSTVRVDTLSRDNDPHGHYAMFKRLNSTIGTSSEHEVRECAIRLLGQGFLDFVASLSRLPEFVMCTMHLHASRRVRGCDRELALRFLAFRGLSHDYRGDRADFLSEFMEAVTDRKIPLDETKERAVFGKTFQILGATLGDNAFTLVNAQGAFGFHFVDDHFEPFTQGLQPFLDAIDVTRTDVLAKVRQGLIEAKRSPALRRPVSRPYVMPPPEMKSRIEIVERELGRALR